MCNYFHELGLENETIVRHLVILVQAILSIDKKYLVCNEDDKLEVEQVERSFTYELYYRWKSLLVDINSDLTINAEIRKKIDNEYMYPDFVLHKSQEDRQQSNQIFACEVKRKSISNDGLVKDFKHLIEYITNPSCFAYGVYIQLGRNFDFVQQKITVEKLVELKKTVLGDRYLENFTHELINNKVDLESRIICISYCPDCDNHIQIKRLSDFIKNK